MSTSFHLREMLPSDGDALRQLMETDPPTTDMTTTTHFLVDPYQAWMALKPGMVGVVAEVPGVDGLVGAATVSFDNLQFEGEVLPTAFLENLKVHHAYRGHDLGTKLAEWRVERARERFGANGIIATGTTSDNAASLATMKKWATQLVGPLIAAPYLAPNSAPDPLPGITIRAPHADELDEIAAQSNHFYAEYNLYPPLHPAELKTLLDGNVYHYRVGVDEAGTPCAGALMPERTKLMYDQFQNVPPAIKESGMIPPDERLRLVEVGYFWFTQLAAAQLLWSSLRWEFRESANTFSVVSDVSNPLREVFQFENPATKLEIVVALHAPSPMGTERLLSSVLRG